MLGLEPPKTITITFQTPSKDDRDMMKRGRSSSFSYRNCYYDSPTDHDYMDVPSSMNTPLRPIFPWELDETEVKTCYNNSNKIRRYANENSNNMKQNRRSFLHQHSSLWGVILLVTLALTAGTLLDGDNSHSSVSSSNTTATGVPHSKAAEGNAFHSGKQRGKHLPAASSTKNENAMTQEMYTAYKELQEDYHTKAFANENQDDWKVIKEKDGAKVSLFEHASDPACPYVRMETIIPTTVADCWEFLGIHNWHWSMPKMDPFYDGHEVYNNLTTSHGVNMILVRKQTHRILTFSKRDFAFLSVSDVPLKDGTFVSGSVSVETPDVPREVGYTRAFQDSIAFYKPIRDEKTGEEYCHLTLICRIDLNDSSEEGNGGFVPMWLYVKTIGATGIRSVLKMRDVLLEMKQEAAANQKSAMPTSTLPPTQSPTTVVPQGHWWGSLSRGGAFSNVLVPQERVSKQTTSSNQHEQEHLRWRPLYQVFTHYQSTSSRKESRPIKNDVTNLWGVASTAKLHPWVQHISKLWPSSRSPKRRNR